ncbi:MAG: DUF2029 domain-containing protein [Bacteroidetes bacterium]|nr:DUF2029 domain-containing protein [Bacteroidota bacterium]
MSLFKNKIAVAVAIILAIIYCYSEADGKGDFYIFLSAADDLSKHINIFETTYVDGFHYYYSVFFGLLLKPFVGLPFVLVKTLWLIFNLSLLAHLFYLLMNADFIKSLPQKRQNIFFIVIFLFSARFAKDNIHHSQVTILILWCCIYGLYKVLRGSPVKGALILALGINIKLLPVVFVPYLFYRGYFKAGCFVIGFYLLLLFLPSVFIGHEYNMSLLKTWFHLINPTNQIHVLDVDERSFHGLSTLLSTLLVKDVPDIYALPLKRNIADVSLNTLSIILTSFRLLLVAMTLYFTGLSFWKKARSQWQSCVEVSYVLLIIPLIFPHQQPYAFLFVIPAVCCICYYMTTAAVSKNLFRCIVSLMVVIFLSFSLKFILGAFNNYYDHYKILTYGALLLIPLLAWIWKGSKNNLRFIS